jgi:acyl-CoA oxidase
VERLTHMFDGGSNKTAHRQQLEALICGDPSGVFLSNRYIRSLAKHVRLIELCRKIGIGDNKDCQGHIIKDTDFPALLGAVADDLPTALHWIMFVPNIVSLFDEQQQAEWLPLCRDWRMIGCYAQMELGHGSNIRAMFVKDKKDVHFVIHSPTITSTKYWPGTLGRTANFAMVIARLIDGDGVDRGIHNFVVPLRSIKDHKLLPVVETGDIGPKIGYDTMDNGFCHFDHVKIPRRSMAFRFTQVDLNGKYPKVRSASTSDTASKVAYITMMQVRSYIVNEAGKNLAAACTISIRYSAVRKQGYKEDNKTENQILNYKQQQHRLFPLLAASFCFFFTGKQVLKRLMELEDSLVRNTKPVLKQEVADVHASSSALKSFTTTVAADGMEDCRKACGGHGFLASSGLPEMVTTYLQNPTVEGDNYMLPQHVVKVSLKLVQAVRNEDDLSDYKNCDSYHLVPSMQSIIKNKMSGSPGDVCSAQSPADMLSLNNNVLLHAFRHRAARLLLEVAVQLETSVTSGDHTPLQAWNQSLVEMMRTSRAYSEFLLLLNFINGIQEELACGVIGSAEVEVLSDLARLFALYWMEREMGDFLEDGYLSQEQAGWVRANVLQLLDAIRPNAVALVDARDFSDFRLKSALGRYDGNVYPAIMEAARRDPLNQTEPGPGYEEHLKRLIVGGVGVYNGTASRL